MKRTPLYEKHVSLGGKMIDFNGWEMPVQYESIISEHLEVRDGVGVFDISHMGEIEIIGERARETILKITPVHAQKLVPGRASYSFLLNEGGGIIDDLIIYTLSEKKFLLVVNAGNIDKDFSWIEKHAEENTEVINRSDDISAISVQGPKSTEIFEKLFGFGLNELKYYSFREAPTTKNGIKTILASRTGYTGEIGFEIYAEGKDITSIWDEVIKLGAKPCGLGARDTLRMEAGMPLYGHELDEKTTPIEAGLSRFIDLSRSFIGKESLVKREPKKKLVGLKLVEKGVPRANQKVFCEHEEAGYITSGGYSPSLREYIGMAYLKPDISEKEVEIEIRGKRKKAMIVDLPFYKRRRG